MNLDTRIFVAGHRGLLGSSLVRLLTERGHRRILTRPRSELDLTQAPAVDDFFRHNRPEIVFLAAAVVGGIRANMASPADFITRNLQIQTAVIQAAHRFGTQRLFFFGSTCLYPRICPQPMREEHLQTGRMEPTSEPYSVAKLAGLVMCESFRRQFGSEFITLIPATLYGPGDNFDPDRSHVISALIRRCHEARAASGGDRRPAATAQRSRVAVWGTGDPIREFLYVDDLADACLFLASMEGPLPPSPLNLGFGEGISIRDLAGQILETVGLDGDLEFDPSKPDGAPAKVLDSGRFRRLGWSPKTSLKEGLKKTYDWYLGHS
jgi:GDP-L-fucose synthase